MFLRFLGIHKNVLRLLPCGRNSFVHNSVPFVKSRHFATHRLGAYISIPTRCTLLHKPSTPFFARLYTTHKTDSKYFKRAITGLILIPVGLLATGGSIIGYALYDSEFREVLECSIPFAKEILDFLERKINNEDAVESECVEIEEVKEVNAVKSMAVSDECAEAEDEPYVEDGPDAENEPDAEEEMLKESEECEDLEIPPPEAAIDSFEGKCGEEPEDPFVCEEDMETEEALQRRADREKREIQGNEDLEQLIKFQIADVERLVRRAVCNHRSAVKSTERHMENLNNAMDDEMEIMTKDEQWSKVIDAYNKRAASFELSSQSHDRAKEALDSLIRTIKEGKSCFVTRDNPILRCAERLYNEKRKLLLEEALKVTKIERSAEMLLSSRDLLEKAKKQFADELNMIICSDTDDSQNNLLLVHAYRRIHQLQRQLAMQLVCENEYVEKELDKQQKINTLLSAEHTKHLLDEQRCEFERVLKKLMNKAQLEFEKKLIEEVKKNSDNYTQHLKDKLEKQRIEIECSAEAHLNESLTAERRSLHTELATSLARLRAIELALEEHTMQERLTMNAQNLWLATSAFDAAINEGRVRCKCDICKSNVATTRPLTDEITGILEASHGDTFVRLILETIPPEICEDGVWSERVLIDNFYKVKKSCQLSSLRVRANSMFSYLLTRVRSLVMDPPPKPSTDDDLIDMENLDLFECLRMAEYSIEQGNLMNSLRFMNQLKGESRMKADDWITDTTRYLEIKQAANLLIAYASATVQANKKSIC